MVAEAGPGLMRRCAADRLAQLVEKVVGLCFFEGDVSVRDRQLCAAALRERHPDLPFRLIPGIPAVCGRRCRAITGA